MKYNLEYKTDCRYFNGEKPCKFKRLCEGCDDYSPMGTRILILKLGAMGDVVRTTPLLKVLKEKHSRSHITWITDAPSRALLENNPLIDKLLPFTMENIMFLEGQHFDLLLSLDKEIRAIALCEKIKADKKMGFGMSPTGSVRPLNPEAAYAYALGLSDDLKFRENEKSYQEVTFEALGLPYNSNEYDIAAGSDHKEYAGKLLKELGLDNGDKILGISPGAGVVFAKKAWKIKGYIELIDRLYKEHGDKLKVLLLGGKSEIAMNREIKEGVSAPLYDSGCDNSLAQFIAIVDKCDIVLSGDTLAMHLGIGLKKRVVSLFGPTCHQEIEFYGRGEKLVSQIDCAPCYRASCDIDDDCMTKISVESVYGALQRALDSL